MSAARLDARVHGEVQGVGYRAFVRRAALGLGLSGYVANREDGTVEVVAEGPLDSLEKLLARLEDGPPESCVDFVRHEFSEAAGEFDTFGVRF